ncbi:hypothetical protein DFJ73DRAFT_875853 [Zopfochytrium polystomum]|nr:hypothetical protein DFJ73DRAFT_875853 [Zopfochytrium polystomum]
MSCYTQPHRLRAQCRALAFKTVAYHKRHWVSSICCVSVCPVMMVVISMGLGLFIQSALLKGLKIQNVLYCSNETALDDNNFPILSTTNPALPVTDPSTVPGATLPVTHVNFLKLATTLFGSSGSVLDLNQAYTVFPHAFCVHTFGRRHAVGKPPYVMDPHVSTRDPLFTADTTFLPQPDAGWLNLPAIETLTAVLVAKQTREWYLVGMADSVNRSWVLNQDQESPVVAIESTALPIGETDFPIYGFDPVFPNQKRGILESTEKRVLIEIDMKGPILSGYQWLPYFQLNGTSTEELDLALQDRLITTVNQLSSIDQHALTAINPRYLDIVGLLADTARSTRQMPSGAIHFDAVDPSSLSLSLTLQIGSDARLDEASRALGYAPKGFRRLAAMSKISNGVLRASRPGRLGAATITQSMRAFPVLEADGKVPPLGSYFGGVLYPFGVSFLMPLFVLILVHEREAQIVTMMRMNGVNLGLYNLAHFATFLFLSLTSFTMFIASGVLSRLELFTQTSITLILLLFALWTFVQIGMAFSFSKVFHSHQLALVVVFLLVMCSVVVSLSLDQLFDAASSIPSTLLIWPPFAFYRALSVLNQRAFSTSSANPYRTFSSLPPTDEVARCLLALAVQAIFLPFLAGYLDTVIPLGRSDLGNAEAQNSSGEPPRPWHWPISVPAARLARLSSASVSFEERIRLDGDGEVAARVTEAEENEKYVEDPEVTHERSRVRQLLLDDFASGPDDASSRVPLIVNGIRKIHGASKPSQLGLVSRLVRLVVRVLNSCLQSTQVASTNDRLPVDESTRPKLAVDGVHLAVSSSEVLGLLGPNGAGKSTLVSVLTGLQRASSGDAVIAGHHLAGGVSRDAGLARQERIGVCPQQDLLWEDLSIREHLYFYVRAKSSRILAVEEEARIVEEMLRQVELERMADKLVCQLSGGQKRRLSIAIALTGSPSVIFLDEPTTGLDLKVRKSIWSIIQRASAGKAVILTTHSMEEAEACCDRIGIMVSGRLRSLGSSQLLKSRHDIGLILSFRCESGLTTEMAAEEVEKLLPPGFVALRGFAFERCYQFAKQHRALKKVLCKVEELQIKGMVTEWDVKQTTLEDVFLQVLKRTNGRVVRGNDERV